MSANDAGVLVPQSHQIAVYKRRVRIKKVLQTVFSHLLLLPLAILFLMPFFWIIRTSLKTDRQVFACPLVWIPSPLQWSHYPDALNFFPFWLFLRNTLFIAGACVVGALISCSMVAYSLSCVPWKGRDILFLITISNLILPYQVKMVPLFFVFTRLDWV